MANDLTITDNAPVDTLRYIESELGTDTAPLVDDKPDEVNDEESDVNDEKSLKLADVEDELKVEDEDDFRPSLTKKEIVAAYPDIFKKFPQLERSIYRDRQFSELFPTIADAKIAIERASTLDNAEAGLFRGEINDILESVKSQDKEAFLRIVDNFLPTIDKLDRGAYLHILGNVGKGFIKSLVAEAGRFGKETEQGKTLNDTGLVLHQFLFGNSEWKEPTSLAKPISEDDKKVNNREQELIKQRFIDVQSDLNERATNAVKATIIQYIDPKESMSEYVKSKAIDDCGSQLTEQISTDKSFLTRMDALWKAAMDSNFNKASLDKIKSTYFAKAQTLLPEIIKGVRVKALAGMGKNQPKRAVSEVEDNPRSTARKENGRSNTNKSGQDDGPKRRESTRDFLNRTLGD